VRATFQSIDVWLAILLGLDFVHHSLTGFKENMPFLPQLYVDIGH
jgi:hypothetical protein